MRRLFFLAAIFSTGCIPRPVSYQAPDFFAKASPRVAVLPFDNQSVDLQAPVQLQQLTFAALQRRGYAPIDLDTVTTKLRAIGITDGGQLPAVDPQTLGKALDVDGLVYGSVEEFLFQDLGFLLRRIVKVQLKLVQASSAERLWENGGGGSTVLAAGNAKDAKKLFAAAMAQKSIENMTHKPLWKESNQAVDRALGTLPPPGVGLPRFPPVPPPGTVPPGMPPTSPPPTYAPINGGASPPKNLPGPPPGNP